MNVLSLFAGIGGFDRGLEQAGFTVTGQIELDPFCQRVLAARWSGVTISGDVRTIGSGLLQELERRLSVDLLVGGFPCQDLSVRGKRAGLVGERSGLFWEIIRIAKAARPTWGLFENVPGLLSSHSGRDMWTVLQGLRECWPAVGYRVLDSRYFGVAQRRRRVFFVCGPTEAGVAQVLALTEGGDGDLAAGGEAGADVARCLATGTNAARWDGESETFVTGQGQGDPLTHALTGEGHDASEDGTGRGTPIVAYRKAQKAHHPEDCERWEEADAADTLTDLDARTSNAVAGQNSVRRLTPVECERLQGFQDGWTCLCTPLEAYAADPDAAALACTCPDSPRYRALGNAVTVPVIAWLASRLKKVIDEASTVA